MSPRFAPDLKGARAGFRNLERGEYELSLGAPKPIYNVKEDGSETVGCLYPTKLVGKINSDGSVDDDHEGDAVAPVRLYVHTPNAFGMTKQFILAAMGYRLDQEDEANEEYFEGTDFSVDIDDESTASLGSSWADLEGKRVRVTADMTVWEGRPSQQYRSWTPITV